MATAIYSNDLLGDQLLETPQIAIAHNQLLQVDEVS